MNRVPFLLIQLVWIACVAAKLVLNSFAKQKSSNAMDSAKEILYRYPDSRKMDQDNFLKSSTGKNSP